MNPIMRTLYGSRLFISAFTIYLLLSFICCSLYSKTSCFIHLNVVHTATLDTFFTWYTTLGDGFVALVLFIVFMLSRRYLQGVHIMAAYLSSGIIAQIIKRSTHMPRPKAFLQPEQYNHFIEGVTCGGWTSFPSGHTTTAFAVATILALYTRNKWKSLLYLLLAISVGYSRIYLGQHFPEDVLAGSIIGVFFAGWIYVVIPELKIFGRRLAGEQSTPAIAA